MNELLRVLMTLFLQERGFGKLPLELYARAEEFQRRASPACDVLGETR
ncbi:hypothetical protein [Caballeronia catudaia]|nr:hypothetical protein [Caballeronia catudaia]